MISFSMDDSNDMIIQNGKFSLAVRDKEIGIHIRTRLMFYLSEWFLDTSAGVPYFQTIFQKPINLANTESILKQKILETKGVNSLINFSMDFSKENRTMKIDFLADTDYGQVAQEVSIA